MADEDVELVVKDASAPEYVGSKLTAVLSEQIKLLNNPRSYKSDKLGLSLMNGHRALAFVRGLFNAPDGLTDEHMLQLCTLPNTTFLDIQENLNRDAQRAFSENHMYIKDHRSGFSELMWTIVQNTDNYVEEGADFINLFSENKVSNPNSFEDWLKLDSDNNVSAINEVLRPEPCADFKLCWAVSQGHGKGSASEVSSGAPSSLGIKNAAESHMQLTHQLLAFAQVACIVVFAVFGSSHTLSDTYFVDDATPTATRALDGYNLYVGVMIMMLVGFGYLMTFMKYYGLGAVGFCLIVTAVGLQWALIWESFFEMWHADKWHDFPLDMYTVYITTTIVAVPLISLGGVIGKITPLQLIIMVLVEIFFHAILVVMLYGELDVVDIGATYGIHMFGCYFGLAVSYILGAPVSEPEGGHIPDAFSLIGTVFLWVYWPSFVGGFLEVDSNGQQYALRNTILALLSSTVMAFAYSAYYNFNGHRRFRPVDIQNATLAGGVAVGALADLHLNPGCALLVGAFCGFLSTWGYNFAQPYLVEKFKLHDTCGINNLHGMPSIAGAIVSIFVAGIATDHAADASYSHKQGLQAKYQLAGLFLTLAFAVVTGLVTGVLMKACGPPRDVDIKKFHDASWWEIGGDEPEEDSKND